MAEQEREQEVEKLDEGKKNPKPKDKKKNFWAVKITIITFFLAIAISFVSEMTISNTETVVAILLLLFLILLSILCDAIAVATTSCDISPLMAMASRKVPYAKQAIALVKNAEKVSNICADVIGDICGIISGACGAAIVVKIAQGNDYIISIVMSSIVAALTVGGKAFMKKFAIKNSRDFVMFTARMISVFYKGEKKNARKNKKKQ